MNSFAYLITIGGGLPKDTSNPCKAGINCFFSKKTSE
jgi:hypothetical protein